PGLAAGSAGDDGARALVRARLVEQAEALRGEDPLVRVDAPGAVHRMRVAVRRLRSALRTFRPMLDAARSEPLRRELGWIAGVLGEERDAEVLRARLAALVAEQPEELVVGPVAQRIDDALGARRRDAHERVLEAMRSGRYFALVDSLEAAAAAPPWSDGEWDDVDALAPLVRRDLRRTARRLQAALDASGDERDRLLHDARRAAKRARYAAEA
ncbi:CHAD domain-containing protein, partial [Agrococcus sp. HG114]|uniref:CHAD domain-containing protein n=1 Tax=Agrococcus sp. HG114 TaxID=2969757 RepID=UPI00215A15B7